MSQGKQVDSELLRLRKRVELLETIEEKHKRVEAELKAANQQLDASNQQLQANDEQLRTTEQQLRAYNAQLQASEKEIKQREIAEKEAREFIENIFDTVRHPLLVLNSDLAVISANRYFFKLFKVSEKGTIGRKFQDLGNKQWDIPRLQELLLKILPKQATIEDFEVTHHFEDIGHRIMLLNARELRQKEGKDRLILLAIEDITREKESESQLNSLNAELEKKATELQQILYITTHDLRSPLVNIHGFTNEMKASVQELNALCDDELKLMKAGKEITHILQEEIPEAIHYITSSTSKMDKLLTGLLTLSRLERQKLSFQTLNMNELMGNVLDNYHYNIEQDDIQLELGELPDCTGDDLQINQLFSNLIGNSLKFFDTQERKIIKIHGRKEKNGVVYIVEDNGIGISKDYQDKIFGMFEKLDTKKPGIGLGLNIVKQIVDKHKGSIQLESELGKGSKFSIFIPGR